MTGQFLDLDDDGALVLGSAERRWRIAAGDIFPVDGRPDMLLAINSGNTNAVFAVYDGDVLRASWRISTNARRTADEYAVWLTHLLSLWRG